MCVEIFVDLPLQLVQDLWMLDGEGVFTIFGQMLGVLKQLQIGGVGRGLQVRIMVHSVSFGDRDLFHYAHGRETTHRSWSTSGPCPQGY